MRDPDQLELVRREVFPGLKGRHGAAARVWSAGCATGEEAYSLAILLEEEGLADDAVVLGTDLSTLSLEKARAGSYSDYSMRDVGSGFLQDYFVRVRGRRILVDRIRSKVRFERLNLVGPDDYASAGAFAMDLILCRNVLIYFGREKVGRIAARLYDSLAEGGVLLTAGADPILGEHAPFEVEVTRVGLVYRRPRTATDRGRAAEARPGRSAPPPPPHEARRAADREEPAHRRSAFLPVRAGPRGVRARDATRERERGGGGGTDRAGGAPPATLLDATFTTCGPPSFLSLDRDEEAEDEAQRALYLDLSLAVGHFLLGTILRKRGARPLAQRAFRNVRDLCVARPSDEEVTAGAGEKAGALHSAASAEMARLEATGA